MRVTEADVARIPGAGNTKVDADVRRRSLPSLGGDALDRAGSAASPARSAHLLRTGVLAQLDVTGRPGTATTRTSSFPSVVRVSKRGSAAVAGP